MSSQEIPNPAAIRVQQTNAALLAVIGTEPTTLVDARKALDLLLILPADKQRNKLLDALEVRIRRIAKVGPLKPANDLIDLIDAAHHDRRAQADNDQWIDPSREQMLALITVADTVTVGGLASGSLVIIGKTSHITNANVRVREFVFHCSANVAPALADRAEELGRLEFAAELRAALATPNLATW